MGSCLCPNSASSGTGARTGSFSPGAFFPFSDGHCQGSTRWGQTKIRKNKHETSKLNSHSDGDCLHWAFARSAGGQPAHPRGAIPTSPLLRGTTPFRLSPSALGTQQLVRFRCLASPQAASTTLLALQRLILIPRIQIPALARA